MRFDPSSGYVFPNSDRSNVDNEGVANKLFETEADLQKFLLIDSNRDPLSESVFSRKEWLAFQYDKIANFDDNEFYQDDRFSDLIENAQTKLRKLSPGLDGNGKYINPIDINPQTGDRVYFSEDGSFSELDIGKIVFDILNIDLWGHATLMLIFLNSIDYYTGQYTWLSIYDGFKMSTTGFKLDYESINTKRGSANLRQHDIHSSTMPLGGFIDSRSLYSKTWSLLHGNSFMFLPVDSRIKNDANKVEFGYTPISFLHIEITEDSQVALNQMLEDQFASGYRTYSNGKNLLSKYLDSNKEIFNAMETKLYIGLRGEFITNADNYYTKDMAKMDSIYDSLSINIKRGLFKRDYSRSKTHLIEIRAQIENLIIGHPSLYSSTVNLPVGASNIYQRNIVFHDFLDRNNNPFEISFNKDDFISRDITIFRNAKKKIEQSQLDALFFTVHENRADSIKKTILENGGKVRFYLAYNTGHETGYQHITTSSLYDVSAHSMPSYLLTPSSEDFQVVPYDIDLTSNDNNIMAAELAKLKFIVGLSMMYAEYRVNNMMVKTNLMLIMKLEGASVLDPSICYFTHNGIGRLFSIHSTFGSVSVGGINRKYGFLPVVGSMSIVGTYNEWSDDNNFFPPIRSNVFASWFGRGDQIFP